jgi:hypothetical protein
MGILLAFMFIWNMLGALVLVPALACFLLKPEREIAKPMDIDFTQGASEDSKSDLVYS